MIQIKQNQILIVLLLVHVALNLHTFSHQQLPKRYNQADYLTGLQTRQNKLNQSMIKIKQRVDALKQTLNNPELSPDDAVVALQEGMAEERDALYNVEVFLNLPFNLMPCNCTSFSAEQRDSLLKEVNEVNKSINLLKNKIVECENCTTTAFMSFQIQREENYLNIISDILNSNCTKVPNELPPQVAKGLVDLSESMYKNNLQAGNWVYGNITEQEYRLQVFASSIKYNLTSCPLSTPYVNQRSLECFDCPKDSKYSLGQQACLCSQGLFYNATENQCMKSCKASEVFNKVTRNCDKRVRPPTPKAPNTDSVCPASKPSWNRQQKNCEPCPQSLPFYSRRSQSCIKCPKSTAWSETQKKCIKNCTGQTVLNPQTQLCEAIQRCKQPTPYWNEEDLSCQACAQGKYWNISLSECLNKCKPDERYNTTTKQCQAQKVQKSICDNIKPIWNPETYSCQICPGETPVWNQTSQECQECPQNRPVFNYTSLKCTEKECPQGQKWDTKKFKCSSLTGICKPFEQYSFVDEKCLKRCEQFQIFNAQNKKCIHKDCNDVNPIWNDKIKNCQPCPEKTPIWNASKNQCQECDSSKPFWNKATKLCEQCKQLTPIFNLTTRTCQACDTSKPFWNKTIKRCEECKEDKPIYNPNLRVCEACDKNTPFFNKTSQKCQIERKNPPKNQTPTTNITKPTNKTQAKAPAQENCTRQRPVWNNATKICEQCKQVTPIFNNTTRTCQACDTSKPFWNKVTKSCQECPSDKPVYSSLTRVCQKCSKSAPVWNQTTKTCQKCPQQYPQFNQTTQKCTGKTCPPGQKWNVNKIKCSSLTGVCKPFEDYNFIEEKCEKVCEQSEIYNSQTELCRHKDCNDLQPIWNEKTKKCQGCPQKTPMYNSSKKQCQQCPKQKPFWNVTSKRCEECKEEKPIYNPNQRVCEACDKNTPFFNKTSQKCLQCIDPTPIYNTASRTCVPCDKATPLWNKTTKSCQKIIEVNKTQVTTQNKTCQDINMYFNTQSQKCVCKDGYQYYPLYNACHPQCQIGYYLNTLTLQCVPIKPTCGGENMCLNEKNECTCLPGYVLRPSGTSCRFDCQSGFVYNSQTDNCQLATPICSNNQVYNLVTRQCEKIKITCPAGSFFDQTSQQCLTCPQKFTYNPSTKQCQAQTVSICPSGYTYNQKTKLCEMVSSDRCPSGLYYDHVSNTCKDLYITSPNADNLISENITAYREMYTSLRKSSTYLQDCVNPAPYYDKNLYACVQCPKEYPYFNLQTNKCQNCGDGTYNSQKSICEPKQVDLKPTLSRFIMNVV